MSEYKLDMKQMREVNALMEEAQGDLEGVLFRLVYQRDEALRAMHKAAFPKRNLSDIVKYNPDTPL